MTLAKLELESRCLSLFFHSLLHRCGMNGSLIMISPHVLSPHRPTKNFGLMVSYLQLVNLGENEAKNGDTFEGGGECTCKMAYISV